MRGKGGPCHRHLELGAEATAHTDGDLFPSLASSHLRNSNYACNPNVAGARRRYLKLVKASEEVT